jgi:hypothetical protein
MGKASSNKKVARAAGTGGGRTGRTNAPWTYYGLIAVVVILGVTFTWTSRNRFENAKSGSSTAAVAPAVGTVWNEAMDVYICNAWQTPLKKETTKTGLSPEGNGVIRIAPKTKAVAGKNATLGNFAKSVTGFTLTDDSIQLPGGKLFKNGDKCNGQSGQLYVKQYTYIGQAAGVIQSSATKVRLANGGLLTVAFVPSSKKDTITAPPESVQSALKDTTTTTSTTTTSTTSTTVAGSTTTTAKSSTTTAKSSTTTAKSSTTTTKSKSKSKKS